MSILMLASKDFNSSDGLSVGLLICRGHTKRKIQICLVHVAWRGIIHVADLAMSV